MLAGTAMAQYSERLFDGVSAPAIAEVRRPEPSHAIVWHFGTCSGRIDVDARMEGSYDRTVWFEIASRLISVGRNQNGECAAIQTSAKFTPYARARLVSSPVPVTAWYSSSPTAPPAMMVEPAPERQFAYAYNASVGGTFLFTIGQTRRIQVRGPVGATVVERGTAGGNPYEVTLGTIPTSGWLIVDQTVTVPNNYETRSVFQLGGGLEAQGPRFSPYQVQ
jgi:hypothetical protein